MGESATIPLLQDGQAYHAFIVHNSVTEREVSLRLYEDLTARGYRCCHADLDFQPGTKVITNILTTIIKSRRVIAIVSPQFLESGWCKFEITNALNFSYDHDQQILIPVLYNINLDAVQLPTEIKSMTYLEYNDPNFWKKLTDALNRDVPLAASIPAGNVAHGLAWSYFYDYLNIILRDLGERVKTWEYEYWKTHPKVLQQNDVDENIVHVGHIHFKASRAGTIDRDYKNSVYKVTDPSTKEVYYAILEFATPILTLHDMEQGAIAGVDTTQKNVQRTLFETKLNEILEHPNNRPCRGQAILLPYRDIPGDGGAGHEQVTRLSTVVVNLIRHELEKQTEAAAMRRHVEEAVEKLGQLHSGH